MAVRVTLAPFDTASVQRGDLLFVKSKRLLGRFLEWNGHRATLESYPNPSRCFTACRDALIWVHPGAVAETGGTSIIVVSDSLSFRLLAASQVWPADSVIEIGCSYGEATRWLAASAKEVNAIDISQSCIEAARMRVMKEEVSSLSRWREAQRVRNSLRSENSQTCMKEHGSGGQEREGRGSHCGAPCGVLDPDAMSDDAVVKAIESFAAKEGRRCAHPVAAKVFFDRVDVIKERAKVLRMAHNADCAFVDIGGNRTYGTVVLAVEALLRGRAVGAKPLRVVVIKSEALAAALEGVVSMQEGDVEDGMGVWRRRAPDGWWGGAVAKAREEVEGGGLLLRSVMIGMGSKHSDAESREARDCEAGVAERSPETRTRVLHPLMFPYNASPSGVAICRYHNYAECRKKDACVYDHIHCHACGAEGHKALNCEAFTAPSVRE